MISGRTGLLARDLRQIEQESSRPEASGFASGYAGHGRQLVKIDPDLRQKGKDISIKRDRRQALGVRRWVNHKTKKNLNYITAEEMRSQRLMTFTPGDDDGIAGLKKPCNP